MVSVARSLGSDVRTAVLCYSAVCWVKGIRMPAARVGAASASEYVEGAVDARMVRPRSPSRQPPGAGHVDFSAQHRPIRTGEPVDTKAHPPDHTMAAAEGRTQRVRHAWYGASRQLTFLGPSWEGFGCHALLPRHVMFLLGGSWLNHRRALNLVIVIRKIEPRSARSILPASRS